MMHKITDRPALKRHSWLMAAAEAGWESVVPPPRDRLAIQAHDLAAGLQEGLVFQAVEDKFRAIAAKASNPPTLAERIVSDGEMAVTVYRTMRGISPREASDPDLWAYLTCFGCPGYVRWRWTSNKPGALWTRMAGNIRRNALARLWWWAHATVDVDVDEADPARFARTRGVAGCQTMMMWVVDCAFGGNRDLVAALFRLHASTSMNDAIQAASCRHINRMARVVCIDTFESGELHAQFCRKALSCAQSRA